MPLSSVIHSWQSDIMPGPGLPYAFSWENTQGHRRRWYYYSESGHNKYVRFIYPCSALNVSWSDGLRLVKSELSSRKLINGAGS